MEEWRPSEKDGDPRTNRNYFKKQKHMLPLKGVCVCVYILTVGKVEGKTEVEGREEREQAPSN
jgi:hypothetical protein